MRIARIIALSLFILFVVDVYVIRNLMILVEYAGLKFRLNFALALYIALSSLLVIGLAYAALSFQKSRDPHIYNRILWIMGLFLMTFIPKLVFSLSGLASDALLFVASTGGQPERLANIRTVILKVGVALSVLMLLAIALGMIRGRFNVKINRHTISSDKLPKIFDGIKVIQMSDMHLSAFYYHRGHVRKWLQRVNRMKPDLFLFTGDMVNNFAEELDGFIPVWQEVKPSIGKYAVLGNHDYGKYYRWKSEEEEKKNLEKVKEKIKKSGFDLLLNEHRNIEKDGGRLRLIGVENYGKPPFPQFGNLEMALDGSEESAFQILMSHDPFHWERKVRKKTNIDLTLSGHTHGMQFGFEIGNFRWSPSRLQYKRWAGLHQSNGQYLHVNRGFGYVGFPGRVGIRPEITEITLRSI